MIVFTRILSMLLITCSLIGSYPQKLLINSGKLNESNLQIGEKYINNKENFLKKYIKIFQLTGGKDKNKIESINKKIREDIEPRIAYAEISAKEYHESLGGEEPSFPYEINSEYYITKKDNYLISLYNDYNEFLGGAHGNTIRTSYTIDVLAEKLLNIKDLFNEGYDYKSVINNEIKKQVEKNKQNYFDEGKGIVGISDNQGFFIEGNNLVIYYQLYEIAPYVFGIPEFKIDLNIFGHNYKYNKAI